ncbi:MAG: hypothetical protein ACOY94_05830 [Bacillota bacterium]
MELDVRGTPAWQIKPYLVELGGTEQPDGSFAGPGWQATLEEGEYLAMRTLFPRVIIRLAGEPEVLAGLAARLRIRVFRVGG